ncbi:putative Tyrosine-protein kinase BAZ1B [Hypsibius exemplaris]|uniref:Tyrosine-protein kinase BAZ1B n=1 Tax=Hypsibius exemplaris TaxID=2072580 RepID=A0A1W0WG00_HYPEX|nr:putative Tyrosine-protein kinase BAZ1B [Hypsibius exemplaris]
MMVSKKKNLPKIADPATELFPSPSTGEYFDTFDALFEHLVLEKLPTPQSHKAKERFFTTEPVRWHDRSLPRIELQDYTTRLDFHLELAVLFLIPITPMRSLHVLVDTLYGYFSSRFIKGESLLLSTAEHDVSVRVSGVAVDDSVDMDAHPTELLDGTSLSPCRFLYDVMVFSADGSTTSTETVRCSQLRRPAQTFTRALLRASILQHCRCREPRKSDSIWSLKKKTLDYYNLNQLGWLELFAGAEPRFRVPSKASKNFPRKAGRRENASSSTMGRDRAEKERKGKPLWVPSRKSLHTESTPSGKKRKLVDAHSSKAKKHKSSGHSPGKAREKTALTSAERAERKKLKQQEYKKRWREKLKREREKLSSVWRTQIFTVGEDLECATLTPLPVVPGSLQTLIPERFIADALFVLEFIRVFGPGLDRACEYADIADWDLDHLYRALASSAVEGEYTRLLGFACKSIMGTVPRYSAEAEPSSRSYSNGWQQQGADVPAATLLRTGIAFHQLPLTGAAISEVVRLCLLVSCVPSRSSESKFDNATLRLLKSSEGAALYRQLLSESVFALPFGQRLRLLARLFQVVIESDTVREMLDEASARVDEDEKALKSLRSLGDEVSKLKGKIVVSKERQPDTVAEKGDRFRVLLDGYSRKRNSLRSDKERSARELAEDIRVLNKGRKHRKLTDIDVIALTSAMEDHHGKFVRQLNAERAALDCQIQTNQQSFRSEPIGMDRHSFKYWNIPCLPGLVIECTPASSRDVCTAGCLCEVVKPDADASASSWWSVGSEHDAGLLVKNMLINGERETVLKRRLDHQLPLMKDRFGLRQAEGVMVVAPADRSVPDVPSAEQFDAILGEKLEAALVTLNSSLLSYRMGGIPEQDQEAWLSGEPAVAEATPATAGCSMSDAPSPEISAPPSTTISPEGKASITAAPTHAVTASIPPDAMEVTEAATMEPIQLTDGTKPAETDPVDNKANRDEEEDASSDDDDSEMNDEDGASTKGSVKKSGEIVQPTLAPILKSPVVRKFVNGIIRLVDTVRPRYLTAPLVTVNVDYARDLTRLAAWRNSVMDCHSLSQLHIHLSVFEKCVNWERSTNSAVCKACRKRGDFSSIAACDRCDKRFHLDCLIPPLEVLPDEGWICPICQPPQRNTRRARQGVTSYNEDSAPPTSSAGEPTENGPTKSSKSSSRSARAAQRLQNDGVYEEYTADEEEENNSDVRRSGRGRRVDYKGLVEGTSQDGEDPVQNSMGEEEEEDDDAVYEKEMNGEDFETVSSAGSDGSEYDPDEAANPKWGTSHKRAKRSA